MVPCSWALAGLRTAMHLLDIDGRPSPEGLPERSPNAKQCLMCALAAGQPADPPNGSLGPQSHSALRRC